MRSKKFFIPTLIIALSLTAVLVLASCGDKSAVPEDPHEQLMKMQDELKENPDECAQMIPVLAYHKIKPYSEGDEETILSMFDTTFKEEMDYLKEDGFFTLTMDEFYQWYTGEIEVPKKSVLITFDDGYYGVYHCAYPVIKENGQAATAFLIGHLIEDETPEWTFENYDYRIGLDAIEEARSEYPRFSYESHTFNMHKKIKGRHPVNVFTRDEMTEDCKSNERFGFTYLAYPWGDCNDEYVDVLKENGYKMAFGYDDPFSYATRDDDQYEISRVRINGVCPLSDFKKIVNLEDEKRIPAGMSDDADKADTEDKED